MVDQATLRHSRADGSTPSASMAANMSSFAHDLTVLAELQAKLLATDFKSSLRNMLLPAAMAAVALGLLVGCFPILLTAVAFLFIEVFGMYYAAGFLIASVVGVLMAGMILMPAIYLFRASTKTFERSQQEFSENVRWIREVLGRSGRGWSPSACP